MSGGDGGGEVRRVSRQDIQLVQNLIERCLQLYMNEKEIVDTLSSQAKIEPSFTELVWQKLEEENHEFFRAYYVRQMLKNQIMVFNRLLEDQYRLVNQENPSGVNSMPLTNGSNSTTLNQSACFLQEPSPRSTMSNAMLRNGGSFAGIINGGQSGGQLVYPSKVVSGLAVNMDASTTMLSAENSTAGRFNRENGTAIKTESSYSGNSDFAFCTDNTFLESCPPMGDASGGSFSNSELTEQPTNDAVLDIDTSSFGFLSQIPRNFSFSDLTEDFTQSAEILENYGRSPFLPSEPNNFEDSTRGECKDLGNTRLDTISEVVSYEDFGSD